MKKIIVSLTAASLIVASAVAADKGIDIVTTGQTALYYQTADNKGASELFNRDSSNANAGVQLNLDADLKNDFTFGSQLTYLDAFGLNKNLVGDTNVIQLGGSVPNTQALGATGTSNNLALTQIYIAKKIANTTVKIGRQELPKALSPLAFSEDWSIFNNTFEAALVVNSDIPNTTLVGAYVGGGTQNGVGLAGNLGQSGDLIAKTGKGNAGVAVDGTAYMVTAQNKSLPMSTITASYYDLAKAAGTISSNVLWADVAVADKSLPMGLKVGLQGGSMSTDATGATDTSAMGVNASIAPMSPLTLTAAYTSVNDGLLAVKNVGGIKTPLYTQMILNQDAIALDADTFMLKAAYSFGDAGTVAAQGTSTTAGKANANGSENDFTDIELVYTVKAGGVNFLAALIQTSLENDKDSNNVARVVARYNF